MSVSFNPTAVGGAQPERSAGLRLIESPWFAGGLILGCGVLYALISRLALDAFPFSGDEYSVFLQADIFARGHLKAPAPPHAEWLRVDHVVIDQWVRSKYPPGTAWFLSLGVRAGVPWLVTPIEAIFALALVWMTTRRALGPRPAVIALATLGLAPLYMLQAASFYSHTPATLFLAAAFAGVAAWSRTQRSTWLWLTGAAIGGAFLVRPMDAVLFGAAMIALRSRRALVVTAAGALPFVFLNFAYQKAQFGSMFLDGYRVYQPTHAALYGPSAAMPQILLSYLWSPLQLWNHVDVLRSLVVDWTVWGSILVALAGAFAIGSQHPARQLRTFCVALIAVFVGLLLFTNTDADDGARPRYLSATLIPITFLCAAGFAPVSASLEARFGRWIRRALVIAALIFAPAQLASFLIGRVPQVRHREGLFTAVASAGLHDAVVIVRAQYPSRYARNGAFFEGTALFLSPPASLDVSTVTADFPKRAVWEAREGEPWTLTQLSTFSGRQ
jgi:hypothetical protein